MRGEGRKERTKKGGQKKKWKKLLKEAIPRVALH
jgi:hypothetical protein